MTTASTGRRLYRSPTAARVATGHHGVDARRRRRSRGRARRANPSRRFLATCGAADPDVLTGWNVCDSTWPSSAAPAGRGASACPRPQRRRGRDAPRPEFTRESRHPLRPSVWTDSRSCAERESGSRTTGSIRPHGSSSASGSCSGPSTAAPRSRRRTATIPRRWRRITSTMRAWCSRSSSTRAWSSWRCGGACSPACSSTASAPRSRRSTRSTSASCVRAGRWRRRCVRGRGGRDVGGLVSTRGRVSGNLVFD